MENGLTDLEKHAMGLRLLIENANVRKNIPQNEYTGFLEFFLPHGLFNDAKQEITAPAASKELEEQWRLVRQAADKLVYEMDSAGIKKATNDFLAFVEKNARTDGLKRQAKQFASLFNKTAECT